MLTCREYYSYLESDYNDIIELFTHFKNLYSISSKALKADVVKLYKYFQLEMIYRGTTEPFTIPLFYHMIEYSFSNPHQRFFKNLFIFRQMEQDNYCDHENKFPLTLNDYSYNVPHFPELSLILLKSTNDMFERRILIGNALYAPYLFNEFFKYLAHEVYNVNRDELFESIKNEYPEFASNVSLIGHHQASKSVFCYFSTEHLLISLTSIYLLNFKFRPEFVFMAFVFVQFNKKYYSFDAISPTGFKRFMCINSAVDLLARLLEY